MIRFFITKILLLCYALVNRCGLLRWERARRMFLKLYFSYKEKLEDDVHLLFSRYPQILSGGRVIDVGAGAGYMAVYFAKRLPEPWRVYAFEPDPCNFELLTTSVSMHRLKDRISRTQAAVGESSGEIEFWHNQNHFADCRVATPAFKTQLKDNAPCQRVPLVCLDHFINERKLSGQLSLIKIDVQGYELKVLQGLKNTLSANHKLNLILEYSPDIMTELGFRPGDLLDFLAQREFKLSYIRPQGMLEKFNPENPPATLITGGYIDLLACRQALL